MGFSLGGALGLGSLGGAVGGGAGALTGGALGGFGGGNGGFLDFLGPHPGGSTTSTTTQDIPAWLMPYVTGNLAAADTARNQSNQYAIPEYLKTIQGDYLNPDTNPYLEQVYKHAAGLVNANIDSRFESAGRYGSGAHAGTIGEADQNLATNLYGGNYQAERSRQAAATAGAPGFFMGPEQIYASLIPGLRDTTSSSPYFTNPFGTLLGLGVLGAAAFSGGKPAAANPMAGVGPGPG